MSEIKMFRAEAELPYLVDHVEGADELLVSFPAYRTGVVEPALWQRGAVGDRKAHRLLLGSDEHTYWGPAQEQRGLRTAVRLVEEVANDLGIPPARVACVGSSNAATLAMLVGFGYGAGVLILGGPPIDMGTLLNSWANHDRKTGRKPMTSASQLFELARRDGGPDPVEWLDGLISSLAAACPHPCRARLFASSHDFVFPGVMEFYSERESFPNVEVVLDLSEAPTHDEMAKEFYNQFLLRALAEELGPAPTPAPA